MCMKCLASKVFLTSSSENMKVVEFKVLIFQRLGFSQSKINTSNFCLLSEASFCSLVVITCTLHPQDPQSHLGR